MFKSYLFISGTIFFVVVANLSLAESKPRTFSNISAAALHHQRYKRYEGLPWSYALKRSCNLPQFPEHGSYISPWNCGPTDCIKRVGDFVEEGTVMHYDCNEGFFLRGPVTKVCDKDHSGKFRPENNVTCSNLPCNGTEWLCKTKGQCIDRSRLCDGTPDCKDSSDETFHVCSNEKLKCSSDAFRCSYGACIVGNISCDGVDHCSDKSDELLPECKGVISSSPLHKCGDLEFACVSGDCIKRAKLCDGVEDCSDGTDETITQCKKLPCEKSEFRCAYGACVPKSAVCNGSFECADDSDEFAPECNITGAPPLPNLPRRPKPTPPPVLGERQCKLPEFPRNGSYTSSNCQSDCSYLAGTIVDRGFAIHYRCEDGYHLRGPFKQTCFDQKWLPRSNIRCVNGCDPLVSSRLQITCIGPDSKILPCNDTLPDYTVADFQCKQTTHKKVEEIGYSTLTCLNGEWDEVFTDRFCKPVCGKFVNKFAKPLIVNGKPAIFGSFPWHAGLYKMGEKPGEWKFQCGGSLISQNTVLSAAHCFKYDKRNLKHLYTEDITKMQIALGKRFAGLHDQKDARYSQIFGIKEVIIHDEWTGALDNFQYDISIVKLDRQVTFSAAVQPVCLDIGRENSEEEQFVTGNVGMVPGWGVTESGEASDELLLAEIPYVDRDTCRKQSKLAKYVKNDKICGGDQTTKQTVCSGDSGGGYVFKDPKTNTYFLRGIVSIGPSGCNGEDYAIFTRVSRYSEFIFQYLKS